MVAQPGIIWLSWDSIYRYRAYLGTPTTVAPGVPAATPCPHALSLATRPGTGPKPCLYIFMYITVYSRVMLINQHRVRNVSDTRAQLSAILDNAQQGYTTHISRDGQIAAHVVPPNALVHRGNEFAIMMSATIDSCAHWITNDATATGFHQAGDPIGIVFGWLWRADRHKAMDWLAVYTDTLTGIFEGRSYARPAFAPLWRALRIALGASLDSEEILEFEAFMREHLQDQITPFTLDELAGRERPRGDNDPWPDTAPTGKGWIKKRWRDVVVGDFVPNPDNAYQLTVGDENWCRVITLTESEATVQRVDGTHTTFALADAGSHWVPFQSDTPYRWDSFARHN